VHPIERLRWIALAHDEAATTLAAEAAWTISELAAEEPAAVVTACRRLVQSHVTAGPVWWVAATLLVAPDPDLAARRAVDDLLSDPTADLLAELLIERLVGAWPVVVARPAEVALEALSQVPSAPVRLFGSSPRRRSELRRLGGIARAEAGFHQDESQLAVQGAALVLVEALAAGQAGVVVGAGTGCLVQAANDASVPLWAVVGAGRVLNAELLEEMLRRAGEEVELVSPLSIEAVIGPAGLGTPVEGLGRQPCAAAPELLVRAG
jgi:hypothetical protein